ncbi:MAG: SusE domain-containing protein [Weeksellaceae bacterium]|nr:SusE domain-containing protein [Weeksellaceae bacterium]
MKKLMKYILPIVLIGTIFSCQEEDLWIADVTNSPVVLQPLNEEVLFDEAYPNNTALTLVWQPTDYTTPTQVNYQLEASSTADFSDEVEVITTQTSRTYSFTTSALNNLALNLGYNANEPAEIFFRVISSIGTEQYQAVASNVVSVTVTPYASYTFMNFYLVGNATMAGWNPNNNNPALFRDPINELLFTFTGYFQNISPGSMDEGRFKVLEVLGQWQPQWGVTAPEGSDPAASGGAIAGNPATQSNDPGRFGVPAPGYYTFTFDRGNLTYSLVPYEAGATAPTYSTIGFIGDATPGGWDTDTDMMQSPIDPHLWYLPNVTLGNGDIKFRADNDWADNWGSDTPWSGVATPGGPNIPVVSGTYNIWFTDLTGHYTIIPVD